MTVSDQDLWNGFTSSRFHTGARLLLKVNLLYVLAKCISNITAINFLIESFHNIFMEFNLLNFSSLLEKRIRAWYHLLTSNWKKPQKILQNYSIKRLMNTMLTIGLWYNLWGEISRKRAATAQKIWFHRAFDLIMNYQCSM